ncbi:MAG: hypothetical protein HY744_17025, partial [Deltaproteobacteria bacterium]|nr:hypothetical protein [Deltaproteobacteria bacterium]
VHIYEPGPYLDTLRGLVESGMSPDTVLHCDDQGQPIRAQDVLDSIGSDPDQKLARKFVEAATQAFVLSLSRPEPEK